jgi:DNA-binding beta-propeller fold protein YncE
VQLYDTTSRSLLAGTSTIAVGSLPDMLTFTPDGSRLLVANEGTPNAGGYGTRIGTTTPRSYGAGANDPVGSVSIIDVASRSVVSTATLAGVAQSGSHIRSNTGMDFEPEYIAVNAAGTQAYVSLQEANAMGVLDLKTGQFTKVVGLGAKDFSQPGNAVDTLNNGTVSFASVAAKGLYMPDGMATFQSGAKTYVVMANEGDFREDDADRSAASTLARPATSPTCASPTPTPRPATCTPPARAPSPSAMRTATWSTTAATSWTCRPTGPASKTTAAAATRASSPRAWS